METNIIESLSDKTLSELCGWENCARESEWQTYVLQNCLRLMDVPTGEFTTEDIRLMIGQDMGVEYLLPLAIKLLRQDPFAEGMYYEGDLLASVIRIKADFWRSNPIWHSEARSIVRGISEVPIEIKGEVERFLQIPQGDAR